MTGILECYSRYCIYSSAGPLYSCNLLNVSNSSLIGKDSTSGICLTYNTANSMYCADGDVCLDVSDSNKCKQLSTSTWIGREIYTDFCLPVNTGNALQCKGPIYCRLTSSVPPNQCVTLDNTQPARIGRYADSVGNCLSQGQSKAESCANNYCIEGYGTATAACQPLSDDINIHRFGVEASTYKCLDAGVASTTGDITFCSPNSCKESTGTGQYRCVVLTDNPVILNRRGKDAVTQMCLSAYIYTNNNI